VIYLPFGVIPFKNDGHRSTNMDQHREFATLLENTLLKWGTTVLSITHDDIKLRVDQVLKFIKEHYK
jgi:nicotinamide riboside kinase